MSAALQHSGPVPAEVIDTRTTDIQGACARLASGFWRRRPVVLRRPTQAGLGSVAEVVAGLRRASVADALAVFADGALAAGHPTHAWGSDDVTPADYLERLAASLGAEEVDCRVDGFEAHGDAIWWRCWTLLAALFGEVGMPPGEVGVELWLTHRRSSRRDAPIQKGTRDALTWMVKGRQTYLVWPYAEVADPLGLPAEIADRPHTVTADVPVLESTATLLEVEAGDLVYWPWDHWLRALPSPGVAVGITMGIDAFSSPLARLEAAMGTEVRTFRSDPTLTGRQPNLAGARMQAIHRLLDREAFQDALAEHLLDRVGRRGLATPPRIRPTPQVYADDEILQPKHPGMFVWQHRAGQLWVSVAGNSFTVDDDRRIVELLGMLNNGQALAVNALKDRFCGPGGFDHEELGELLGCLGQLRAFQER